jgi:uncharacterized membrane protein
MEQNRIRKIVVTGVLSAIAIMLSVTPIGYIPWFAGASLTILTVPVIIGAILEGPVVGAVIGLIFGISSLIRANVAPQGPSDVIFTNPLISVLPRIFIGPVAWLVWRTLQKNQLVGLGASGVAGTLTNTVMVLGMIGLLNILPWGAIGSLVVVNGLPEAVVGGFLVVVIVAAWKRIQINSSRGANLE